MGKVRLRMAIAEHPHTAAIRDGSVPIEGVEAEFVSVKPQIAAFRRMVRDVEFDVCELAPTTYLIARYHAAPFVALPIFVSRQFHHSGLLVRPDAGVAQPKDLEGKRVGVRAYSVTTGVWLRQALMDDFGLDPTKVTWVVDDEEHVCELVLPDNVVRTPEGRSLAEMMADGELAAGVAGAAGICRTGAPSSGWQEVTADYPDLLPNAAALEADYFRRTGICPMHGTIVIKDSILAEHPWIAGSLFNAFTRAKEDWLAKIRAEGASTAAEAKYLKLTKIVGDDPLPYGIEANVPTIEALARAAFEQRLTPRRMSISELFAPIH